MTAIGEPPLHAHLLRTCGTPVERDVFSLPAELPPGCNPLREDSGSEADFHGAPAGLRILFVSLSNDLGSERIIGGMAGCGVECAVMSPPNYFCASTRSAKRHFPIPDHYGVWLGALFVRRRLEDAVRNWQPRLILPLDDISAWLLRGLAVDRRVSPAVRGILVESLGAPEGYAAAVSRQRFMDLAANLGVYKPAHCEAVSIGMALLAAESWGFPLVVKGEHTCGGRGVVIVRGAAELVAKLTPVSTAWQQRLKFSAKKALFQFAGFGAGPMSGTMIQSFVMGTPAFRTLAAWKGRVIEGVSFAAEQMHPTPTGASTVVRHIENDEMNRTAAKMTAALGCSGFVSFDFMLDQETGRAALIEMNPRSITSTHLGALFGRDVCGAFTAELLGNRPPAPRPAKTEAAIALFPKELERDPDSKYLKSPDVIHDVPNDDPLLVAAHLRRLRAAFPRKAESLEWFPPELNR